MITELDENNDNAYWVEIENKIICKGTYQYAYTETDTCRDPDGSVTVTINGDEGVLQWYVDKPFQVAGHRGSPAGTCDLDLVLVVDRSLRTGPALEDIGGGNLQSFVDDLELRFDTTQFALVEFSAASASATDPAAVVESFALNNGDDLVTAVNALTASGGDAVVVESERTSHTALQLAAGLAWRDNSQKVVILLNSGYPESAVESNQLAYASDLKALGAKIHAISISTVVNTAPTSYFRHSDTDRVNSLTAVGGTHRTALPDGTADYNGGDNELLAGIENIGVAEVECQDGRCGREYCTNCSCAERQVCARLVTCDCLDAKLMDFAGQYCAGSDYKVKSLLWTVEFTCYVASDVTRYATVSIGEDKYTKACILQANYKGTDLAPVTLNGCGAFDVSVEIPASEGGGFIQFTSQGNCGEACNENMCWEQTPNCLTLGSKPNCCGQDRPAFWSVEAGWFDDTCAGSGTCPVPTTDLFGEVCYGSGDDCTHRGGNAQDEWVLYLVGESDAYLIHEPTGIRYVPLDGVGWSPLCDNVLFRENLCGYEYYGCLGDEEGCPADWVCLYPENDCGCSLSSEGRPYDLPDTLTFTYTSCCGDGEVTLTWNATRGGWELIGFTTPSCTGTVDLFLYCDGNTYYLSWENGTGNLGNDLDGALTTLTKVTCFPFVVTGASPDLANNCPVTTLDPITFTIAEEIV